MTRTEAAAVRECRREQVVQEWAQRHKIRLQRLDIGQQWVVYAALRVMACLGSVPVLRRVVEWALMQSGMDLGSNIVGAITGVSARTVRDTQAIEAPELLRYVQQPVVGHRKPKLKPEHAGLLAKYLVEHKGAKVNDILAFIQRELGVGMDRLTLRRYIKRYGLGCLRNDQHADEGGPFFSAQRSTVEPFC